MVTVPASVAAIRAGLDHTPWVVVRAASHPADAAALRRLAGALGTIVEVGRSAATDRIARISPSTDDVHSGQVATEGFHTDSAGWVPPNDLTCLLCVRPDQHGGGRTRLLHADDFVRMAREITGWDRWVLTRPVPWKVAAEFGGGTCWAPIVDTTTGSVRWAEPDAALDLDAVHSSEGGARQLAALGHLHRALATVKATYEVGLRAGDLVVIDNHRCLHARTAVDDPARSRRLLLRAKVSTISTGRAATATVARERR